MWLSILSHISGQRQRLVKLRRIFLRKTIPPKILIVRNDGLGDFILTLPIVSSLRHLYPHARLYVLSARTLHSLSSMLPEIDGWITDPGCLLKRHRKNKKPAQIEAEYASLVREIRAYRFDLAIFSYAEKHSARLAKEAGIPYRLGPLRRSFFSQFNLWYYISRQTSSQGEFQFNLKILRSLKLENRFYFPQVRIPPLVKSIPQGRFIVMHPYKRSGTALVWPLENFQALAQSFSREKIHVVVIGDKDDESVLCSTFGKMERITIQCGLTLLQTASLLQNATHFFGNSSGPLHLAALVGTPHTGFYPQNKASSARRWRTLPLKNAPPLSEYLLSTNFPVESARCRGPKCPYYPCTTSIEVSAARKSMELWKKPTRGTKTIRKKSSLKRAKKSP